MTFVYSYGRVPQLVYNYRRKSTEGLSFAMFMLVILANVTYSSSILVHSTHWHAIKPRLPWLVDALLCLVLDMVIMLQFYMYRGNEDKEEGLLNI